jgi:hypothetical protein
LTVWDGNPTHICSYTGIKWGNLASDEKREFKQTGEFISHVKTTLSCQGTYKVSNNGVLDLKTNCQSYAAKIEGLSPTYLIVKEGERYHTANWINVEHIHGVTLSHPMKIYLPSVFFIKLLKNHLF